jgi:Pentapeptide repeats (8 copies)
MPIARLGQTLLMLTSTISICAKPTSHMQACGACNLHGSDLSGAILDHADLAHANLTRTRLVGTSLDGTDLFGAWVYGAAIWDIRGVPKDDWLSIQPDGSRYWEDDAVKSRVPGIKTAQFMYAMATRGDPGRNGVAVGELVEALGRVTVLLLGRFSEERKSSYLLFKRYC